MNILLLVILRLSIDHSLHTVWQNTCRWISGNILLLTTAYITGSYWREEEKSGYMSFFIWKKLQFVLMRYIQSLMKYSFKQNAEKRSLESHGELWVTHQHAEPGRDVKVGRQILLTEHAQETPIMLHHLQKKRQYIINASMCVSLLSYTGQDALLLYHLKSHNAT